MFLFQYLKATLSSSSLYNDLEDAKTLFKQLQEDDFVANDEILHGIITILQRNAGDRRIALLTSHMISNLALSHEHATKLCNLEAIKFLFMLLELHPEDNRVIWKAASALWNLFTVGGHGNSNISHLVPPNAAERLMQCLCRDCGSQATHTIIGALGNLVLILPDAFLNVMTIDKMEFIGKIAAESHHDAIIAHYAAFVANMASNTNLAKLCVMSGQVEVLISLFRQGHVKSHEATKHVSAALHNLSDVEGFIKYLCMCEGVEIMHKVMENTTADIALFIDAIFDVARIPRSMKTSLQAAATVGDLNVITKLICRSSINLNALNSDGHTACDIAIQRDMGDILELLIAAGGQWNVEKDMISADMKNYLDAGLEHRFRSKKMMNSLITDQTALFNDMSGLVSSFIPGADMLLVLQ